MHLIRNHLVPQLLQIGKKWRSNWHRDSSELVSIVFSFWVKFTFFSISLVHLAKSHLCYMSNPIIKVFIAGKRFVNHDVRNHQKYKKPLKQHIAAVLGAQLLHLNPTSHMNIMACGKPLPSLVFLEHLVICYCQLLLYWTQKT